MSEALPERTPLSTGTGAVEFFDSLTHVTADGSWVGSTRHDARCERLVAELERCAPARACLVAIAGLIDNDVALDTARQHPGRFVPIGSINPAKFDNETEITAAVAQLAVAGFAGLKLHPRLNGYDPLHMKVVRALRAAEEHGLVVFLDTLFRQSGRATRNAPDMVDALAVAAPQTKIVLLHGGGSQVLAMSEVVAAHSHLTLDLSFTIHRYAGSSVDDDLRFLLRTFDRRMVVGSDFPEYEPLATRDRVHQLCEGLDPNKLANVLSGNLSQLFAHWQVEQAP